MSADAITCELVDERDLDTRYLTGKLSPAEAEAFEAHYFGCEACWKLVNQGMEVRSALAPTAGSPGIRPHWWGLAAAAGIAAVALGLWRLGDGSDPGRPEDVLRGEASAFVVNAAAEGGRLVAAWPRLADADVFRVRLYSADGLVVFERETPDSFLSVPLDSLAPPVRGGPMFWQVQALDGLRNPIVRSDLVPAALPNQ